MKIESIIGNYQTFVTTLLNFTYEAGLDVKGYSIDHVCYRCDSLDTYNKTKNELMSVSSAFLENLHNNRPISKFILKEPLKVETFTIPVIELPAPKPNSPFRTGLEHIEFVVGDDYQHLKEKYKDAWSHIDDSGAYNQPLVITFANFGAVKFHEYSMIDIIHMEGNEFTQIIS